jgi:hypothetical protein
MKALLALVGSCFRDSDPNRRVPGGEGSLKLVIKASTVEVLINMYDLGLE